MHLEDSKYSPLARQAKTKVIKKEPIPKQWSLSQLNAKRYPKDSQHVAHA